MTKPYRIATPRAGKDGKTFWTDIGTMWPMDGGKFSLSFDALPVPQLKDGKLEIRAVVFPPKDNDGGNRGDDGDMPF